MTYSPSGISSPSYLFHAVDVGLAVDEPTVLADAHDGRLVLLVELVVQIADELFEDVANRHHARHAAVLVEHQREGPVLLLISPRLSNRSNVSGNMSGRRILRVISSAVGK